MALLFCGTDGPEEVRRTRARALRILDALPEREREVLRLRFLRGYTAAEIGQALGLTAGNVRILQLRALRRAAAAFAPPDDRLAAHADAPSGGSNSLPGEPRDSALEATEEMISEHGEHKGGSGDE